MEKESHRITRGILCSWKATFTEKKTAEEQFNMLARGWLAYPVTPVARATTAEVRL